MNEMPNSGQKKQLRRSRDGRIVAGVAAGLGDYLGVDPNLVRLGLAILTLFGGTGVLLYILAWLIIPEEGEETSIAQGLMNKNR